MKPTTELPQTPPLLQRDINKPFNGEGHGAVARSGQADLSDGHRDGDDVDEDLLVELDADGRKREADQGHDLENNLEKLSV